MSVLPYPENEVKSWRALNSRDQLCVRQEAWPATDEGARLERSSRRPSAGPKKPVDLVAPRVDLSDVGGPEPEVEGVRSATRSLPTPGRCETRWWPRVAEGRDCDDCAVHGSTVRSWVRSGRTID
ncbi:hypothetical protein NDU88_007605 [Pleurodeles waltl]|uniref:Uncharacterized protein n=1 Tax=Pleurodeles waltl TaxID=8319 RepID=A0AAV7RTI7_PLEWA|nr:hypothetical protein NDU88_007605 [Pleurodeles waltl]